MKLHDLMTSDFITEGYTPDELISILLDFRYEYRKSENEKTQLVRTISEKDESIYQLKMKNEKIVAKNSTLNNHIKIVNKKINKRLSTWERITGKIKI